MDEDITNVPEGCLVTPYSSRMCLRGTRGCGETHVPESIDPKFRAGWDAVWHAMGGGPGTVESAWAAMQARQKTRPGPAFVDGLFDILEKHSKDTDGGGILRAGDATRTAIVTDILRLWRESSPQNEFPRAVLERTFTLAIKQLETEWREQGSFPVDRMRATIELHLDDGRTISVSPAATFD